MVSVEFKGEYKMDLSKIVVRKAGVVDVKASVAAFRLELDALITEEKTENSVFEEAAHTAFDKAPGTAIPMPALLGQITTAMNAVPANYTTLTERARKYIQNNAVGEKSTFVINKGKGGGVRRRADIPATSDS
jgi:hypothetical protein